MTTTPADKPDDASAVDPGAIDVPDIKARYEDARKSTENNPWNFSCDEALRTIVMEDHPALIAAVEALRKRVAELETKADEWKTKAWKMQNKFMDAADSAEAAEARVVDSYAAGLEAAIRAVKSVEPPVYPGTLRPHIDRLDTIEAIRALGKEGT